MLEGDSGVVDNFFMGSVETPWGKLLVSVEAINDAGTELVLQVSVQPTGFGDLKFEKHRWSNVTSTGTLEAEMSRMT